MNHYWIEQMGEALSSQSDEPDSAETPKEEDSTMGRLYL